MTEIKITTTIELDEKNYGIAILIAAETGTSVEEVCSGAAQAPCQMAVADQLTIYRALTAKPRTN